MTRSIAGVATLLLVGALLGATSPGKAAYEKANVLFVATKLPESLTAIEEALQLDSKLVPALTWKAKLATLAGALQADLLLPGARLLLILGHLDDSERWLRQAVKLSPGSRDAHFELARLLLKGDDAAHAAEEGETALRLSDGVVTDTAIHSLLVRAWQQDGKPDRAAAHAEVIRAQETPVTPPVR